MTSLGPCPASPCPEEPFLVVYNYRKTKQLKKARELRKAKLERLRLEKRIYLEESRRERQETINRNMFEDDFKWDLCYENYRMEKELCEDENSTLQQEPTAAKSLTQLRIEAVSLIPAVPKQMVFAHQFEPFLFQAAL